METRRGRDKQYSRGEMPPPRQMQNKANSMNHLLQRRVIRRHGNRYKWKAASSKKSTSTPVVITPGRNGSSNAKHGCLKEPRIRTTSTAEDQLRKCNHEDNGNDDDETETEDEGMERSPVTKAKRGHNGKKRALKSTNNAAPAGKRKKKVISNNKLEEECQSSDDDGDSAATENEADDEGDDSDGEESSLDQVRNHTRGRNGESVMSKVVTVAHTSNDNDDEIGDDDSFDNDDDFDLDSSARGVGARGTQEQQVQVGNRIAVYWSGDDEYYEGTVTRQGTNPQQRKRNSVYVEYDDGESEWIDLEKTKIRIAAKRRSSKDDTTKEEADEEDSLSDGNDKDFAAPASTDKSILEPKNDIPTEKTEERLTIQCVKTIQYKSEFIHNPKIGENANTTVPEPKNDQPKRAEERFTVQCVKTIQYKSEVVHNPKIEDNSDQIVRLNVGSRVSVWSSTARRYIDGTVITIDNKKAINDLNLGTPHYVVYDNGDDERTNLACRNFILLGTMQNGTEGIVRGLKAESYNEIQQETKHEELKPDVLPISMPITCKHEPKVHDSDDGAEVQVRQNTQDEIDSNHSESSDHAEASIASEHTAQDLNVDNEEGMCNSNDGSTVRIGHRVAVYWSGDDEYYEGKVLKRNKKQYNRFYIEYDDGDHEWIDVRKRKFRHVDESSATITPSDSSTDAGRRRKRKQKSSKIRKGDANKLRAGARVSVWKSKEKAYVVGTLVTIGDVSDGRTKASRYGQPHHVVYDNGDEEHTDLSCRKFKLLRPDEDNDNSKSIRKTRKPRVDEKHSDCSDNSSAASGSTTSDDESSTSEGEDDVLQVGERIAVYWSGDDEYYEGMITKQSKKRDRCHVEYDDGDNEWVNVKKRKIRLACGKKAKAKWQEYVPTPATKGRKRRKANPDVTKVSVGSRVSVWWPAEKEYFDATVKRIKADSAKPYRLAYDDGDYEKTNLACRKFVLIS